MIQLSSKSGKKLNITTAINKEISLINSLLDTQNQYTDQILSYLNELTANISNILKSEPIDKFGDYINTLNYFLQRAKSNNYILNQLLDKLYDIKLKDRSISNIDSYNAMYCVFLDRINFSFSQMEEVFGQKNTLEDEALDSNVTDESLESLNAAPLQAEEAIKNTVADDDLVENTLIISEIDEKVILPYTIKELNDILENHPSKYKSVKDIITHFYTKPLKIYKNSTVARFREAFKLIREHENGSITDALGLAFELAPKYSLHPAIITACKNIDELDIYLSCLEYNELDDFKYFKIVFNSLPTVRKTVNKILKRGKSRSRAKRALD